MSLISDTTVSVYCDCGYVSNKEIQGMLCIYSLNIWRYPKCFLFNLSFFPFETVDLDLLFVCVSICQLLHFDEPASLSLSHSHIHTRYFYRNIGCSHKGQSFLFVFGGAGRSKTCLQKTLFLWAIYQSWSVIYFSFLRRLFFLVIWYWQVILGCDFAVWIGDYLGVVWGCVGLITALIWPFLGLGLLPSKIIAVYFWDFMCVYMYFY